MPEWKSVNEEPKEPCQCVVLALLDEHRICEEASTIYYLSEYTPISDDKWGRLRQYKGQYLTPMYWMGLPPMPEGMRHGKLQKPLTLAEVKAEKAVWVEDLSKLNSCLTLYPAIYFCETSLGEIKVYTTVLGSVFFRVADYNGSWRCWLKRPTEAERKAAKWGT